MSMEGNVPLIESIITRSGYGVKLRFTDGSIGAVNIKDLSSEPVTDVTKVVVVDGQLGIHTLTTEGYVVRQIFPIVVWMNAKMM